MGKPGRPRTTGTIRNRLLRQIDRKPIRPLERQRMRPWMMDLLDRGVCRQLAWLSKRKMEFRISWKHAAGQSWEPGADASLFELWARHTGKYYDGDEPNPKKWKANFRCALHSLRDIEQDRVQGIRRGNNACKVYKFLDYKKSKKQPTVKEEPMDDYEVYRGCNRGTNSRPRDTTLGDLDSEDSEVCACASPAYRQSDTVEESQKSPLPNFEQLCFSCPNIGKMERVSPMAELSEARQPDVHSPQAPFASDDDDLSTTSSAPTDEDVIDMLIEPESLTEYTGWDMYYWLNDNTLLEGPEETVHTDDDHCFHVCPPDSPNVIVLSATGDPEHPISEFVYTSIKDL